MLDGRLDVASNSMLGGFLEVLVGLEVAFSAATICRQVRFVLPLIRFIPGSLTYEWCLYF